MSLVRSVLIQMPLLLEVPETCERYNGAINSRIDMYCFVSKVQLTQSVFKAFISALSASEDKVGLTKAGGVGVDNAVSPWITEFDAVESIPT